MADIPRVSPQEARKKVAEGALLVCAYDSEEKFNQMHLEGAISLDEFRSREEDFSRDREIIFYCA